MLSHETAALYCLWRKKAAKNLGREINAKDYKEMKLSCFLKKKKGEKKSSAWIHMVWDFSSVTFLLRLCIWPFIFILLVLIAVYWTLRYCVQRTHASPRHCHRCECTGLYCCPQIGTCCCCLTTTAGNILLLKAYLVDTWVELLHSGTSKQNEWTLCGQLMVTKKKLPCAFECVSCLGIDSDV